MGRFITEDPIKDGSNWFIYALNNPLKFVDPTGLWIENSDGTYTAEKDDTLWKLAEDVTGDGNNWEYYEIDGDPTAEITPEELEIGTIINVDNMIGFSDMDSAAHNITDKINPDSIRKDKEIGGVITEEDGTYRYTRPVIGEAHSMPESTFPEMHEDGGKYYIGLNQADKSRQITGIYHTHGASQSPTDDNFSEKLTDRNHTVSNAALGWQYGDKFIADTFNVTNYVGTPGGNFRRYIPNGISLGGSDEIIGSVSTY